MFIIVALLSAYATPTDSTKQLEFCYCILTKFKIEKQWRTQDFFFRGGGVQKIQLRTGQTERGSGGGSPLVSGSGGSCNLVQEISFHIVKFSKFLVL